MKISLPSRGLLGCKEVDMAMPCYKHLRDITQVDYPVEQIGYEFVKSLLPDPTALDKMTYQDKDYLLAIAVASMHLNSIPFKVTCSCGKPIHMTYDFGEQDLYTLPEGTTEVTAKELDGVTYEYHFLSATDEQKIVAWAKEKADGDDKAFKHRFEEGFICRTFGFDLDDEGVKKVSEFPMLVYYSALLFREMTFHGCSPVVQTQCKACGQPVSIYVPFAQSLMSWSSADIVNEFMTISKFVGGFDSFLRLTFAELAQMQANLREADK